MQSELFVPRIEHLESRLCFAIQNGGFEDFPDFAGFQTAGPNAIRGGNFYVPVPEGEVQGILLNGPHAVSQDEPATAAELEAFAGLTPGTLSTTGGRPAVEGSAIKQVFAGAAGDELSFRYNLLTNEPTDGRNDFAFFALATPPGVIITRRLAQASETRPISPVNFSSGFARETGYQTFTFTLPAAGTYTLALGVVDADDAAGNSALLLDAVTQSSGTPPRVTASAFQFTPPHALRLDFSEDVSASLAREDLVLENLTTGTRVDAANISLQHNPQNGATFTFPGLPNGVLPNGNCRATLPATSVTDAGGTPLAQDAVVQFFVLHGDINRDRSVTSSDFATLASNFGKTGMTYAQGDLTGDGAVSSSDFATLAANFGRTLPPPAAATSGAALGPASASASAQQPRAIEKAKPARQVRPVRPWRLPRAAALRDGAAPRGRLS